jgi:hypothetical protein
MSQSYRTESPPRISDQAQPVASTRSQRLSLLAALCIMGQVILLASAWLLPLVSEYSLVSDSISELSLGRFGLVQAAAFVLSGLGVLGLAYALRQFTAGAWGSLAGSLLVAVYGVGAILAGIFPTDRIDSPADLASLSTTGTIHSGAALASFLCITAGMVVLAWTFSRAARWRSLLPWAAILATAAVSLMLGQFFEPQGPWVGITQRGLVTLIAVWLITVALRVRAIAAPKEATTL